MDPGHYQPRFIDKQMTDYLNAFGAVSIEGAKWTGKTRTSLHFCRSSYFLDDPSGNFQNRSLAELSPDLVLKGETPRLLDEWQEVPHLWDAVRHEVDRRGEKGQFILTGSMTPVIEGISHSGAGRIASLRMRPMSLAESGDSSGDLSLEAICEGEFKQIALDQPDLRDLAGFIIRGGWPGSLGLGQREASLVPKEYLNQLVRHDIYRMEGIHRDSRKMELLLRSLARHESRSASIRTLAGDIREEDEDRLSTNTITSYLSLFERLFLIENQEAYSSNIRSSVRLKQVAKHHFVDPSLAAALLEATEEKLIGDLKTLGLLFEALVVRDLRIYAESFGARLYHYQDYANREIDAVIELSDGRWSAYEIKLGAHQIDEAAGKLLKIKEEIQEDKGKAPEVLCVICGLSRAAYLRQDSVYVLPLTALTA